MDKERRKNYETELGKFLAMQDCTFPGWDALQKVYKNSLENLGPGCSKCQKAALKRKFAAKIQRVYKNRNDV